MWIMKHEGNCQEWHNTTSKDKVEKKLHSGLQDEECLSSSEKNLDEHSEKGLNPWWIHHVEPSWRTPVIKEWSKIIEWWKE